jgi:hypothetical protein
MTHDQEANWASSELARLLQEKPEVCFDAPPKPGQLSTWASHEGKNIWPHADGVVVMEDSRINPHKTFNIAVEYKRPNEGLHGILTAMGQANAYLRKGYHGSAIVIPKDYKRLPQAGRYVREVLEQTNRTRSVGVFVYSEPDVAKASPFLGKIEPVWQLQIDTAPPIAHTVSINRTESQWIHLREGSSEPDAFFRYLQAVKLMGGGTKPPMNLNPPAELVAAVQRLQRGADPAKYLSNTINDTLSELAWRYFWFTYVLTEDMMIGWTHRAGGQYVLNDVPSKIRRLDDGSLMKKFFSGRNDSIKNRAVGLLNQRTWSANKAWENLAENFRNRAHSYREDIDSGLEALGYLEADGHLSEEGYRFVDACERSGDPNTGTPRSLLLSSLMQQGGLGTFLHYVFFLSSEKFKANPLDFTQLKNGKYKFLSSPYLKFLEDKLASEIKAMRKVSLRGGTARKPFQAELALLRSFGLVEQGFRIGVGLPINWPKVQNVMEAELV